MHAAVSSGQGEVPLLDRLGECLGPVRQAVWQADRLAGAPGRVLPSGHPALDRELPGGGWPCQALTDILLPPALACEWRLLGPALARACGPGEVVVLVGAGPAEPHVAGLEAWGLGARQVVWVRDLAPAQALWATEQALHCRQAAAVLAWLPQARPEALRRLQAHAQRGDAPLFVFRPAARQAESCAAPLRVLVGPGRPWSLSVRLLKRRGPAHAGSIELPGLPPGLAPALAPRLRSLRPAGVPPVVSSRPIEVHHGTDLADATRAPRTAGTLACGARAPAAARS
jgi:protein ImuA